MLASYGFARLRSVQHYKNQCGDDWEVFRSADKALIDYRRRVGDEAFNADRRAIHDAFRAEQRRLGLPASHGLVRQLATEQTRKPGNWGLRVFVYAEILMAEQDAEQHAAELARVS